MPESWERMPREVIDNLDHTPTNMDIDPEGWLVEDNDGKGFELYNM